MVLLFHYVMFDRNICFLYAQHIKGPHTLIEEDARYGSSSPVVRVEKMFEKIVSKFPSRRPQFLLCILPERKTSDIYGEADFCYFNFL